MEIKKCTSCGAFITTNTNICSSCMNKMHYDMTLLKNYFEESPSFDSISSVSAATGVAPSSIQKYIQENELGSEINPISFSSIQY